MSKIRVLKDTPVLNDSGVVIHAVEMAGPSGATKPTADLANGSMYIETDNNGNTVYFDEVSGSWPVEE